MNLTECVTLFLMAKEAEGRSPHTIADYANTLRLFVALIGDVPVAQITTADVRRFLATQNVTNKTVRNYYGGLSSLWTWLHDELGIPHVVRPVRPPHTQPTAFLLPTPEQVMAMVDAVRYTKEATTTRRQPFRMQRPTGLRDQCILLILVGMGLRASELCRLQVGDVEFDTRKVRVKGKGKKERIVRLPKRKLPILLKKYLLSRESVARNDWLLVNKNDDPLTRYLVGQIVAYAGERVGIRCWPHLLRHVFATEYLRGGGSILTLKELLGHASNEMVERYAHLVQSDVEREFDYASPLDRWRV